MIEKAGYSFNQAKRLVGTSKDWDKVINLWKDGEVTAIEVMRRLNMNRGTFYRRAKEA